MVGKILKIEKKSGDHVDEDEVVIVMEAMKMEIPDRRAGQRDCQRNQSFCRSSRRSRASARRYRIIRTHRIPRFRFVIAEENPWIHWTFGWTLALIGMGGTMLVLWILSLLILLIRKIFPYSRAIGSQERLIHLMESALVSGIQGLFLGVLNLGLGQVIMIVIGSCAALLRHQAKATSRCFWCPSASALSWSIFRSRK